MVQCVGDGRLRSYIAAQDLARTFPGNAWVASGEGQGALRRVLLAFSAQNPRVGYCQSMNFLAAALLLALGRSEEMAFWVLVCLIDDGGMAPIPCCLYTCEARTFWLQHYSWPLEHSEDEAFWPAEGGVLPHNASRGLLSTLQLTDSAQSICNALAACRGACRAGILYQDTYARDLTGAHVEMRSLEVRRLGSPHTIADV